MTSIPWTVLIEVILRYGVPFAEKLWSLIQSGAAPTAADWEALRLLTTQDARSKMAEALAKNGIDPASELGKSLLELAS